LFSNCRYAEERNSNSLFVYNCIAGALWNMKRHSIFIHWSCKCFDKIYKDEELLSGSIYRIDFEYLSLLMIWVDEKMAIWHTCEKRNVLYWNRETLWVLVFSLFCKRGWCSLKLVLLNILASEGQYASEAQFASEA